MASNPATATAGPVPAPVEASGFVPVVLPSFAVFGETAGLVVPGVLPLASPVPSGAPGLEGVGWVVEESSPW